MAAAITDSKTCMEVGTTVKPCLVAVLLFTKKGRSTRTKQRKKVPIRIRESNPGLPGSLLSLKTAMKAENASPYTNSDGVYSMLK